MTALAPYIIQRQRCLYVRIRVPADIAPVFGQSHVVRSHAEQLPQGQGVPRDANQRVGKVLRQGPPNLTDGNRSRTTSSFRSLRPIARHRAMKAHDPTGPAMPCLRHTAMAGWSPTSASFKMPMICSSVNLLRFI